MTTGFVVRVRDVYVGVRGKFTEECVTHNELEARTWFKQWKAEYPKDEGFSVKLTKIPGGIPDDFVYSL